MNNNQFSSKNGLKALLEDNMDGDPLYPVVHYEGTDIEVAFTAQDYLNGKDTVLEAAIVYLQKQSR